MFTGIITDIGCIADVIKREGEDLRFHIQTSYDVASIADIQAEDGSHRFTFDAPRTLARFVAQKGSVALDGASLTVNDVSDTIFGVNIIPHTAAMTTFGDRKAGDRVNMEIDVLARYVARLSEMES